MVDFEELLEHEMAIINEGIDLTIEDNLADDEALLMLDEAELKELMEELDISQEEMDIIVENTRRAVNSAGNVRRIKTRKTRSRNAVATTGLSKTALKQRARRAARTRKKNPAGLRVALKRRKKAMRKRKMLKI